MSDSLENRNISDKLQLLILDDEAIVCKRLKPAFQKAGYEVETFVDSASAKSRINEGQCGGQVENKRKTIRYRHHRFEDGR